MDEPTQTINSKNGKSIKVYEVYICPICGANILKTNKSRHNKSRKHKQAKYVWYDRVEMK